MTAWRARALAAAPWLAVLGLAAWSAWHRWHVLTASPHPLGIDGYFYPIQVRSLLERGHLAYPAAPLTFYLMAAVAAVTDVITATKLVAAVGGALATVPAYAIGRRLGGIAGGLAAAALVATSGGSFYLSCEFVKNGVGLTVALGAVWAGLRALERPTRGALAVAALAVLAALLTHKMAAALVAALLAPAAVVELRARRGAAVWRWAAIAAAALVVVAVVLGTLWPERFVAGRDLGELREAFGAAPRWHLPAMYIDHGRGRVFELRLGEDAPIAAGLVVLALVLAALGRLRLLPPSTVRPADRAAMVSAAVVVVVTAIPYLAVADPDGLGFRLRVAVFAPAALVAAWAVGRAAARLAPALAVAVVAPVLTVYVATTEPEPREGLVVAHPALVAGMLALDGRLPPDAVVITSERHLGFMAAWYARVPVRMRPEPVPPARRWRLLAGNRIELGSPLDKALRAARAQPDLVAPIGLHPWDPDGLVVVPEATWTWVLTQVPPPVARYWRRWPTR